MSLYYPKAFRVFIFFLFLCTGSTLFAQQFQSRQQKRAFLKTRNKQISRFTVRTDFSKSKKYISFGGGIGISNYFGDLAPNNTRISTDLGYSRLYLTGYYLQRVHPNVTLRGAISYMMLRGDDFSVADATSPDITDYGRFIRNLSFRSNVFELSGVGLFELFPTDRGFLRRTFINPYFMMGLSFFYHNPQSKTPIGKPGDPKSDWVSLRDLGTEGQYTGISGTPEPYSLFQIGVPLGIGVRYRLLDKFDLSLELGYRFVFTDYLDDVSGSYPSDEVLTEMYNQGNYQGILMSNRSAETIASLEELNRVSALNTISRSFSSQKPVGGVSQREQIAGGLSSSRIVKYMLDTATNTYLTNPDYPATSDFHYFRRVKGNQFGSTPRGSKRRDYWLVTALHLSYILEIKQKPPKFR